MCSRPRCPAKEPSVCLRGGGSRRLSAELPTHRVLCLQAEACPEARRVPGQGPRRLHQPHRLEDALGRRRPLLPHRQAQGVQVAGGAIVGNRDWLRSMHVVCWFVV